MYKPTCLIIEVNIIQHVNYGEVGSI